MDPSFLDVMQIRDLIERWAVCRDTLQWDKFREIWHPDGIMTATWTEGSFEDFIRITDEGVKNGLNILHIQGGSDIEVKGTRAVAASKFMILQRAMLDGVLCDVTCYARQYDLWEKRGDKWGLVHRRTIPEKDRIDPVNNDEKLVLDRTLLARFPEEYRYLAYLQTKIGYNVDTNCPRGNRGEALEAVYRRGADWLAGK